MKKNISIFFLMLFAFFGTSAYADNQKAEIAQDLVKQAIAHFKSVGLEKSFKDFNDKNGSFVKDEFYVIVFTEDLLFKTHAFNPKLIDNTHLKLLADVNGKLISQEMLKAGKNNASGGWAEYVWTNPTTKKLEPKKTWVVKHDSLYFAVGFYE